MKEVSEIYEQMLKTFEGKTGFAMEDTADLAVRLYAAAAQIQAAYIYAEWALTQSFPQRATGKYLDDHAKLRGIIRKEGHTAKGVLRFKVDRVQTEAVRIPAGVVCTTAGLVRFVTREEGVIEAGNLFADVEAEAENVGAVGNVPTGSIRFMTKAPTGITGVTNPAAFAGGSSEEDDEALRERVLDSFRRLPNGANAAFYELRALSHASVEAVRVLPRYQGIGTVGVVVAAPGGIPEEDLLRSIQEDLDAVREIAVDVTVMAPEVKKVDVEVEILPKKDVQFGDAQAAVRTAMQTFFTGELLGEAVYRTRLGKAIFDTGMVENYVLVKPEKDISAEDRQLPQLGILTVTEGT